MVGELGSARTVEILIHDEVFLAAQRRLQLRAQYREIRKRGSWLCKGGCGRTISTNKLFCAGCNAKTEADAPAQ